MSSRHYQSLLLCRPHLARPFWSPCPTWISTDRQGFPHDSGPGGLSRRRASESPGVLAKTRDRTPPPAFLRDRPGVGSGTRTSHLSPADAGAAAQGPRPENTGCRARPNTAAPPGMPRHALVLTAGPHATSARCVPRSLLSSLRHVCLPCLVGARPGPQVLLPHIRGASLHCGFALGDGVLLLLQHAK